MNSFRFLVILLGVTLQPLISSATDFDATNIVIGKNVYSKKGGLLPAFSKVGSQLAFATYKKGVCGFVSDKCTFEVVVVNIPSGETLYRKEIDGRVHNLVWGPESNTLAVCRSGKKLVIINREKDKKYVLDYVGRSCLKDRLLWTNEQQIYIESAGDYYAYDLVDLEKTSLVEGQDRPTKLINPLDEQAKREEEKIRQQVEEDKQNVRAMFEPRFHADVIVKLKKETMGGLNGYDLLAYKPDGLYARLLKRRVKDIGKMEGLKYIAYVTGDNLQVAEMTVREPPSLTYAVELDKKSKLTDKQRKEFEMYYKGGTIDGYFDQPQRFHIYGDVYEEKVNPINQKSVGPDMDEFKGVVRFVESNDKYSVVTVSYEVRPIEEGDVVANIRSEWKRGRQMELPKGRDGVWAPLLRPDSSTEISISPEEQIQLALERYIPLIKTKVSQNWKRPENVPQDDSVVVEVHLSSEGEVEKVEIVRSSGNTELDDSVISAVRESSILPIPKSPQIVNEEFRKLRFRF